MARESQLYYHLYSSRNASPQQIFACINLELAVKTNMIRGFADILHMQVQETPNCPPSIRAVQADLAHASRELQTVFRGFAFQDALYPTEALSPDELMVSFRSQVLPHIDTLGNAVASMQALAGSLQLILSDAEFWMDRIEDSVRHIEATVDVLTNPDFQLPSFLKQWLEIRDTVAKLAQSGDRQALAPLLEALGNPEPDIRREAVELLRFLKDGDSAAPLIALLDDEDEQVRGEAAETLGTVGDHRAVEPLIACLTRYKDCRWGPARALGDLPDPRAVRPLIAALEEELAKEQPIPRTVGNLVKALESVGGPEAEEALKRYRESKR
jgi:HEAT repeat protein